MQPGNNDRQAAEQAQTELEQRILEGFLSKPRAVPKRPAWSGHSMVIIRKESVPFYYAIYDHDLGRFTELQYRAGPGSPLRHIPVPEGRAQPLAHVAKSGQ